jgi:hypothetical protein
MARSRDISKVLSSNTTLATDAEVAATYQTKATNAMTLINTTNFTGVASVSLPADTFTSTYKNYRVILEFANSGSSGTNKFRFRTSGSDNTTSNYQEARIYATGATVGSYRAGNATSFADISATTTKILCIMDILGSQTATTTLVNGAIHYSIESSSAIEWSNFSASFSLTTSFDSMSVFASATNITGTITAYGYNN